MRIVGWWLLAMGCGGEDTNGDTDAMDTDVEDTEVDDTGAPAPVARLSGTVTRADGSVVAGAQVNFCKLICQTDTTDASGQYAIEGISPNQGSFYVVPQASAGLIAAMNVVTLAANEDRALDVTLLAPTTTVNIPATATLTEVADGLEIAIGADVLEPAPLTQLGTTVYSAEVPEAQRPPVELDGTVVAMWYIGPFEAESAEGMEVRVANAFNLAAGTTAKLWAAGTPEQAAWLPVGEVTVSSDGTTFTGTTSLTVLTTLALTTGG